MHSNRIIALFIAIEFRVPAGSWDELALNRNERCEE
jgi:hypothetical protein